MTEKMPVPKYRVRLLDRISQIDAAVWNTCAGQDNPFVEHGFFEALEESGSVSPRTGFQAKHLIVENTNGTVLGVAPQYLRKHAYAGHGPDGDWIPLFRQRGLKYFPKLQVEVPYMPNAGERLLVRKGQDEAHGKKVLITQLKNIVRQSRISSLHIGYINDDDRELVNAAGFTTSAALSNIWHNRNYGDFEEFLADLHQRKRSSIRGERRKIAAANIQIKRVFGSNISADLWRIFYQFHTQTNRHYGTTNYLNEEFFHRLGEKFQDKLFLTLAISDGKPVAGTLHIVGKDFIFPRYWGGLDKAHYLHFECTYHDAVEYAIKHGLDRIDAGPGGDHKIRRGFMPEITLSAHYFPDQELHSLIDHRLIKQRQDAIATIAKVKTSSPYIRDR